MIMKLTKFYIGLLCGMAALSSCNDFLDREPLDEITPENSFIRKPTWLHTP